MLLLVAGKSDGVLPLKRQLEALWKQPIAATLPQARGFLKRC
jgi:hypothetical protein